MEIPHTHVAQEAEPNWLRELPQFQPDFSKQLDKLPSDEKYVKALNAPVPTEKPLSPPLSTSEQQKIGDIVKHFQKLGDEVSQIADGKTLPDDLGQSRLDFEQDVSCLNHDQLQRLLPTLNKQLEPLGYRMVEMPDGREIGIGDMNQSTGQWRFWGVAAVSLNCANS
jgi:hypothetical protein